MKMGVKRSAMNKLVKNLSKEKGTKMTNEERFERIGKELADHSKILMGLRYGRKALVEEWKVYEDEYKKYIAKRDRFRKSLWWLFCKVTFRSTKLTEKELNKRVAKKMARVFYKGNR